MLDKQPNKRGRVVREKLKDQEALNNLHPAKTNNNGMTTRILFI
jgi:hypothetical protein